MSIDADVDIANELLLRASHGIGIRSINTLRATVSRLPTKLGAYVRALESAEVSPESRAEKLQRVNELTAGLEALIAILVRIEMQS